MVCCVREDDDMPGLQRAGEVPSVYEGMGQDELNFHRTWYYLAGAVWALGLAGPALDAISQLIQAHQIRRTRVEGEARLVRPFVR